jgi:hypothetical protein
MENSLNLLEETLMHFREGARSIKAYSNDITYIITQAKDSEHYWITIEESNFEKTKTESLESYFKEVFGIEAFY